MARIALSPMPARTMPVLRLISILLPIALTALSLPCWGRSSPAASKLPQIFRSEMVNAQVGYVENIIGPAMHVDQLLDGVQSRDYMVDGCEVIAYDRGGQILGYSLGLTAKCNIDLNNLLGNQYPTTKSLTVGKFAKGAFGSYSKVRASCIYSCGNAADPTVDFVWEGPHAANFLTVVLTVKITDHPSIAAAQRWSQTMIDQQGERWVVDAKFNCTTKYDNVAIRDFSNIRVNQLTVGYDPFATDYKRGCDEHSARSKPSVLGTSSTGNVSASPEASVIAFLTKLYAPYSQGHLSDLADARAPKGARERLLEPSLAALWRESDSIPSDGPGPIDGDPVCDCQEADISRIEFSAHVTNSAEAVGTASFMLGRGRTTVIFQLAATNGQWRIRDVVDSDDPLSLRQRLEKHVADHVSEQVGQAPHAQKIRKLEAVASLRGTCMALVAAGTNIQGCQDMIASMAYSDGRESFTFWTKDKRLAVTFSGDGSRQTTPERNVIVQPIDGILAVLDGKHGDFSAVGTCRYVNSNSTHARVPVSCTAVTDQGRFTGDFMTDGRPPQFKHMDGR